VILGAPNAGKSVILNTIVKARLAAISHKRHTTRSEILGVFNHRNVQLAFHDTPGFVRSSEAKKLDTKTLQSLVRGAASRADVALLVVDAAREVTPNFQDTFAEMAKIALDDAKIESILVLNKVDLVEPKTRLIELTRQLVSLINGVKLGPEGAHLAHLDTTTFMISALHNDGVIDLKNYLISLAPRKQWIIPKEFGKTDLSPEERVEQILLQVMLEHTHEEIPYIAEYTCLKISNLTPKRIKIETEILVDASNQQRIVIGEKGRTLVKLRQSAVDILEGIFGKEVILMINVRSRDNKRSAGGENVNEMARREMKNDDKDV